MKLSTIFLLLAIACKTSSLSAQTSAVPEIQYRSVPDFLHLPADLYFGEVTGVAVNSKGHIFVFSRGNTTGPAYGAAAAQLLEFGSDGKFLREIGHNLYAWSYAHTVKIDPQDNIWVTDKGSDVVVKFTPDGRVSMVFGRKTGGLRRWGGAAERAPTSPASRRWTIPPGNGCGLGFRGQHLYK